MAFLSSFEEESVKDVAFFRDRIENPMTPTSANFGAFDGDRLIGLTAVIQEGRMKRRHKMLVVSVFVRQEYRGRRIASRLMEAAIAHARGVEGVERLELGVASSNGPAKALYASFGFTTWGTEPEFLLYKGKKDDEEYMTLKL